MVEYQHTQVSAERRIANGSCALIMAVPGVIAMFSGEISAVAYFALAGLFVACIFLLGSLTVRVSRSEIALSFGVGLFSKKIATDNVHSAAIVRAHRGLRTTLHRVAGRDAVEVLLNNGRKIQIGTDEPQKLLAAIESAIEPPNPAIAKMVRDRR